MPPVQAPVDPPRKRRRGLIIAVLLVVILIGGAAGFIATRPSTPPGPPGAPTGVAAKGQTCVPPRCSRIKSSVVVSWASSGDAAITGYHVFRNGIQLPDANLPGSATSFEDTSAGFGTSYDYTVTASSVGGTSPASASTPGKPPFPPASAAQLRGNYVVRLTVQHTEFVASGEGIKNPKAGDTTTETWDFNPVCRFNSGPCSTTVDRGKPPLRFGGKAYSGSVTGSNKANCRSAPDVPVRLSYHLETTGGREAEGWVVKAFTGTFTVTFACGGFVSTGTFSVKTIKN